METTFAQALEEYNFNRPEAISAEAFEILSDLFPALAIVLADEVDGFEQRFLDTQLARLLQEQESNLSALQMKAEIAYILQNMAQVEPLFVSVIKHRNRQEPQSEALLDLMLAAARVSYDSWENNMIFVEPSPWLKLPQRFLAMFLSPDSSKKRISENEKMRILSLLEAFDALNNRNQAVLESLS
jgi:hypothetical protein